jgi:hypothetical protein
MSLTRNSMGPPTTPTAETVRELLRKTATLTTRLAELGDRGKAAAAALAKPGAPPPDDLVHALGEATREFATLRQEVFAAAAALGLQTPAVEAVDSTRRLDAMVKLLLEGLENLEREAGAASALTQTVAIFNRIASLRHLEDAGFAALAACQSRAADVRAALAASGTPDPAAAAPFASLLALIDGRQKLDDEHWGALEDAVAAAFGRPLAVAASRGKIVGS